MIMPIVLESPLMVITGGVTGEEKRGPKRRLGDIFSLSCNIVHSSIQKLSSKYNTLFIYQPITINQVDSV